MHEEMHFQEELKQKGRKKSDDDDLNLLLIVTAGAAATSLNSRNGGPRALKNFRDKLRWTNGITTGTSRNSHLRISTGCFQYILNIISLDIEKSPANLNMFAITSNR